MGYHKEGIPLLRYSMENDLQYPKWFLLGEFLYHLDGDDFEMALQSALLLNKPDLFWSSLMRLVGHLLFG
jgi:hypothetical protein